MTEREIDTAIDRAVRDLMDVDTDAAFRARVTARLQRPARRMLLRPVAAVALTAAAVAVAVVWMRPSSPDVRTSTPVAVISNPTAAAPPSTLGAGSDRGSALPGATIRTQPRPRRAAGGAIPRGTVVATVAEAPASTIAPLAVIDPIDVEPISQTPIAPSEIVLAPLSPISEMQISPLEPRSARN
jgi:hypothetical protein